MYANTVRASSDVNSGSNAARPMRKPQKITSAASTRETKSAGLFMGDHKLTPAKPHCTSASSKFILTSSLRTTTAMMTAKISATTRATMSATIPGSRFASLVRNSLVDWSSACLT